MYFILPSSNVTSLLLFTHCDSNWSISDPAAPSNSILCKVSASGLELSVTPRMNSWSRTSMVLLRSFPLSESVLAIRRFSVPIRSHWNLAATSLLMCSAMGTSTLPARWPHFFPPCSWSSKWTAAAPFSAKSLASFSTAVRPPCLGAC